MVFAYVEDLDNVPVHGRIEDLEDIRTRRQGLSTHAGNLDARNHRDPERVRFVGRLPEDDLAPLLTDLDAHGRELTRPDPPVGGLIVHAEARSSLLEVHPSASLP